MKLSQIEERLLAKEIDLIQFNVNRGLLIINDAIGDIPRSHQASEIDEEREFIEGILKVSKSYSTGQWRHNIESNLEMPDSIKKALLKRSVADFLARVEEIGDITDGLGN